MPRIKETNPDVNISTSRTVTSNGDDGLRVCTKQCAETLEINFNQE